jgi:OOP family OmpA-OmpF porin
LGDELQRTAVDSFARANFGSGNVYQATRLDPELPDGWPVRVLAGLEALAQLDNGKLLVRADTVEISGVTGSQGAKARIAQVLSDKLGQGKTYKVAVTYEEALDPVAAGPTPQECAKRVADVMAKGKITFTPGSAEIDAKTQSLMDALAKALKDCTGIKMEIAGHTDAQGSEEGNRALSQARAEAVLLALQGRQVDVSGMVAKGYGETMPLAENETELGREFNRRIEFTLIGGGKADKPAAQPEIEGADAAGSLPQEVQAPAPQLDAAPAEGEAAAPATGPDFSGDTSPSVAPKDKTRRPEPRPEKSE